jgi:predicted MFS family arabinose efflux permease
MTDDRAAPHKAPRFLWLFALAWAGGAIAYVPFLTILLPLRIIALSGADGVRMIAIITFLGAICASVGNILFGWLSDRSGVRKPWVAAGLVLSQALLVAIPLSRSAWMTVMLILFWQLALNMMLGPLSAWAADRVPRTRTGFLGGLMALSPALGALSGVVVTVPGLAGPDQRLWLVAAMVAACVLPVVIAERDARPPVGPDEAAVERPRRHFAVIMWTARLLVQIAEAALFAYLLLYFRSLDPLIQDSRVARLFSAVLAAAVPVAILAGQLADRSSRPALPLAICALCSGLGLLGLAAATTIAQATLAYVWFGLATTVFLSLHSGQTLLVLPNPAHRGRDLGLFNLTNTVPSMIMPWLTVILVPQRGFPALFAILALLALASSALLFAIKRLD